MNPNKALWEKGDFTRIAVTMRESSEALVKSFGIRRASRSLISDAATERPRCPPRLLVRMFGVDIAENFVKAGNKRAREHGLSNCTFQEGEATDLRQLEDPRFDLVVSAFGAMFAPKPFEVAKEMVRVSWRGGRIVMGNRIPRAAAYTPPPPEGFVSTMTGGGPRLQTHSLIGRTIALLNCYHDDETGCSNRRRPSVTIA